MGRDVKSTTAVSRAQPRANITALPVEIIQNLTRYLNLQEFGKLALSHPRLSNKLLSRLAYCEELVQQYVPCSEEAEIAASGLISYRKALTASFQKRYFFAEGKPLSVVSFPVGDDFLYQDGTLCTLKEHKVSIFHPRLRMFKVLDLRGALAIHDLYPEARFTLLAIAKQILSVRIDLDSAAAVVTIKLDDSTEFPKNQSGISSISKGERVLEVRNNDRFSVIALYRRTGQDSSWHFHVLPQGNNYNSFISNELEVGQFTSSDVGVDLVFELIDDELWIISSGITIKPEGENPISYYGGCRCRLSEKAFQAQYWRIWRRRHTEGPIDESWTNLRLFKNDQGEFVITETRCEWLSNDHWMRNFYSTVFVPGEFEESPKDHNTNSPLSRLASIADTDVEDAIEEILARVDARHLTVFEGYRYQHAEFGIGSSGLSTKNQSYIYRSHQTLTSYYNHRADAFIDLVLHREQVGNTGLKLRFGSRDPVWILPSLKEPKDSTVETTLLVSNDSQPLDDDIEPEESFIHNDITLYPPQGHLPYLGFKGPREVKSYVDDKAIVLGPRRNYKAKEPQRLAAEILIVNFDPLADWEKLKEESHYNRRESQDSQPEDDVDSENDERQKTTSVQESPSENNADTESSGFLTWLANEQKRSNLQDSGAEQASDSDEAESETSFELYAIEDEMREAVAEAGLRNLSVTDNSSSGGHREDEVASSSARKRRPEHLNGREDDEQPRAATLVVSESSSTGAEREKKRRKENSANDKEIGYPEDILALALNLKPH